MIDSLDCNWGIYFWGIKRWGDFLKYGYFIFVYILILFVFNFKKEDFFGIKILLRENKENFLGLEILVYFLLIWEWEDVYDGFLKILIFIKFSWGKNIGRILLYIVVIVFSLFFV